jgi:predicted nucleic acid-binding protein
MTEKIFVDSNVFVYARDQRDEAKHLRARAWIQHLWAERLGCTSHPVLSEVYVTLTRKLKRPIPPAEAWEEVRALLTWRPLPVDESLLLRAREIEQRYRLSWWDSMVIAAAQLQECGILLTEDLQDGQVFGTVTVRSPFKLAAHEPQGQYAASVVATPRHRPRGRPKRVAAGEAVTPARR